MATRTTPEYRREMVYAYKDQPYGTKCAWLKEHNITRDQINAWHRQLLYGDLLANASPRSLRGVTLANGDEVQRLRAQLDQAERENKRLTRRAERAEKSVDTLNKAVDALGKAMEHMPVKKDE